MGDNVTVETGDVPASERQRVERERAERAVALAQIQNPLLRGIVDAVLPEPAPPSPNQRLRISVPMVRTDLTIGYKAGGGDVRSGLPSPSGFGATTDGDIFMDAELRMALQAKLDVCIQSETENAWVGAAKQLALVGKESTSMTGGGGVFIGGGAGFGYAPRYAITDSAIPGVPNWGGGWSSYPGIVNNAAAIFDAALGVGMIIKTVVQAKAGTRLKSLIGQWPSLIGAGISSAAAGFGGAGWGPNFGGVTLFGTAGFIGMSPGTMGLYSGAGTAILGGLGVSIMSPLSVTTLANEVEMAGRNSATVKSSKEVLISGGDNTEIAARMKRLKMVGKTIYLGTQTVYEVQQQTEEIDVESTKIIEIKSGTNGRKIKALGADLNRTGGSIHLHTKTDIGLAADGKLGMEIGGAGKSVIQADADKLSLHSKGAFGVYLSDKGAGAGSVKAANTGAMQAPCFWANKDSASMISKKAGVIAGGSYVFIGFVSGSDGNWRKTEAKGLYLTEGSASLKAGSIKLG